MVGEPHVLVKLMRFLLQCQRDKALLRLQLTIAQALAYLIRRQADGGGVQCRKKLCRNGCGNGAYAQVFQIVQRAQGAICCDDALTVFHPGQAM